MKKFHVRILVLAIAMFISSLCVCYALDKKQSNVNVTTKEETKVVEMYSLVTKVTKVDYDNDIVECEDFNGNVWSFYGCEDWSEEDCAGLLMSDNGTKTIYDDEVINARYCGWILERWN